MASQTSLSNLIATMSAAQKYLYEIGCPVLMLTGIIGSILNLIVFTQKALRKNPCSIYFIAYNLANLAYIHASLLPLTLNVGYSIDTSSHNLVICRLRLYVTVLFNCLSPFYLILASIDRILVTSRNALTRQRSTCRFAYICLIRGTLFWILFHSHALVLTNIIQLGPNIFLCYFQLGVYLTFISYYSVMKEMTAFLLMLICGLWSIKNIRSIYRHRPAADLSVRGTTITVGNTSHSTASKDRQLILMLLIDTTMYALFSFAYAIFLIYGQITQNYTKGAQQTQIETIVRNICLFSAGIPFCLSCYANLIVSKAFRNEVRKAFTCNRIFCIH